MELICENPPGGCATRVVADDCPRQSWNFAELPEVVGRSPVTWKSSGLLELKLKLNSQMKQEKTIKNIVAHVSINEGNQKK